MHWNWIELEAALTKPNLILCNLYAQNSLHQKKKEMPPKSSIGGSLIFDLLFFEAIHSTTFEFLVDAIKLSLNIEHPLGPKHSLPSWHAFSLKNDLGESVFNAFFATFLETKS